MRIVSEPIKKGKLLTRIDVYASVKEVASLGKEIAKRVICGYVKEKPLHQHLSRHYLFPPQCNAYIQYPLCAIVELPIEACTTIGELLWKIARAYQEIYDEEEKTSKIPVLTEDERAEKQNGSINRNHTNGKYGIWGHDIEDLEFETIIVYDNGVIAVGIGS